MRTLVFASAAVSSLLLTACDVDTTGLSAITSRTANPATSQQATVTVSEYADLQCPACASAYSQIAEPLIAKYGTSIGFEFNHFPLRALHQYALDAAEASECAADQGKFWEYIDLAYTKQTEMNRTTIKQWASDLGLDMDLFGRCTDSHIKRKTILGEHEEGTDAGVLGTPTFFVNGKQVESDLATISAEVDAALARSTQHL